MTTPVRLLTLVDAADDAPATSLPPRTTELFGDGDTGADADRALRAVHEADLEGDPQRRSLARAALVQTVLVPRRQFRAARRWSREALDLTVDPRIRAHVLVVAWLGGAVLGDAWAAEEALLRASQLLGGATPLTVPALVALRSLVAHDLLGRREHAALHEEASQLGAFEPTGGYQWVAVRTAVERGDVAAAVRADEGATPPGVSDAARQLRGVASASLAMAVGRPERAHVLLREVLDVARQSGSTLAVPEAWARLIVLDAGVDLHAAQQHFEDFEDFEASVGSDTWLPRENVLRLLARAAIRAADARSAAAASSAAAAADAAETAGLVHLAAIAHRHRAVHLAAAGHASEARLAQSAAARWQRSATTREPRPYRPGPDATRSLADDLEDMLRGPTPCPETVRWQTTATPG